MEGNRSDEKWKPDRDAARAEYLTDEKALKLKLIVRGKLVKSFAALTELLPSERKDWEEVAAVLLHLAARFHNAKDLQVGLSQGLVTPDSLYKERTALQWAVINSNGAPPENHDVKATVKLLLDAGANPKKNVFGDSLADVALKNSQVEIACHLMKHSQKDIRSVNPLLLPDPEKHSGLWGYMLTSKDAQLSCESLDWMSDDMIKLFPQMPIDVQISLFAPNSTHDPSATIKTANIEMKEPGVKMPANPSVGIPFHFRKKGGQTLLQYIFDKKDDQGNAVYDEQQLYRITSMLTKINRKVCPHKPDQVPWVMDQLRGGLCQDSAPGAWITKVLPTAADCADVDVVLLGKNLPLDSKFDGSTVLQLLVRIAHRANSCEDVSNAVSSLIDDGADLLVDGRGGMELVNTALENNQARIVWLLLRKLQSVPEYPIMRYLRSDGVEKVKVKHPDLWGILATSHLALDHLTEGLIHLDEDTMNFLFTELPLEHQVKLFGPTKKVKAKRSSTIQIAGTDLSVPDNSPPPKPLHMVLHEGKSLLQHIADKKDMVAKQREDFTRMMIRIDENIYPGSADGRVDRVIQVLKDGIETSDYLHAWTESVKNKLPLPRPEMWLRHFLAVFFLILGFGLFLMDLVTDGLVNEGFLSNSYTTNQSIVPEEAPNVSWTDKQCRPAATTGSENEILRYAPQEWKTLFWISTVHLCFPWLLFIFVGLSERSSGSDESCKAVISILFYPLAVLIKKCRLQIELNKNMAQDSTKEKKVQNYEKLRTSLDKIEKQEILFLVIEVTSESSFQCFLQAILAIPQVFLGITAAYSSESPFMGQIFNLRLVSILSSFIVIARSYYKIRDLTKKGALSVHGAGGLLLLLRILIDTVTRIMSVGLLLYMLGGNMNPLLALLFYYLHFLFMVVFNLIFNNEKPNLGSATYWRNLLLNSLSSQYSYTHFEFTNLIRGNQRSQEEKKEGIELHQPSLIRQSVFYLIVVFESMIISAASHIAFHHNSIDSDGSEVMMVTNGFGEEFPFSLNNLSGLFHFFLNIFFSLNNLSVVLGIIWFFQLLISPLLLLLYYAAHPSSVSLSAIKPKLQVG